MAAHAVCSDRLVVDFAINDQRMPGVVTALKAGNHIGPLRQPIDNLAFSLVSPLGTDNNDIGHDILPLLATEPPIAVMRLG